MNGKGDKPRNCQSEEFRNNYGEINWSCESVRRLQEVKVCEDIVIVDILDTRERLNN